MKIVKTDKFRSSSNRVCDNYDMVRVVVDMPLNELKDFKKLLKKEKVKLKNVIEGDQFGVDGEIDIQNPTEEELHDMRLQSPYVDRFFYYYEEGVFKNELELYKSISFCLYQLYDNLMASIIKEKMYSIKRLNNGK